jgi:hypothetical protein
MLQETRHPVCKTADDWPIKKALEQWETKTGNCEVAPQAIWPAAKSLLKRNEPRAPIAIHGPLRLEVIPLEKANATADCLENQFTSHDLFDENHEWWVKARVQALLEAVDNTTPERIPSLKLKKACRIYGIPKERIGNFPRRPLLHLTYD